MTWLSDRRLETYATVLLSLGALATSWNSYQSTLWSSQQSEASTRATRYFLCASERSTAAGQLRSVDLAVFMGWLTARADSNVRLARFYEERFRPEFVPAFRAWLAAAPVGAAPPSTPFASPVYRLEADERVALCERRALAAAAESQRANRASERYVVNTVIFAIVLFFAGATSNVKSHRPRLVLLGVAVVAGLTGMASMVNLPVSRPLRNRSEAGDAATVRPTGCVASATRPERPTARAVGAPVGSCPPADAAP